jgi:hypothetical protein
MYKHFICEKEESMAPIAIEFQRSLESTWISKFRAGAMHSEGWQLHLHAGRLTAHRRWNGALVFSASLTEDAEGRWSCAHLRMLRTHCAVITSREAAQLFDDILTAVLFDDKL